MSSSTSCEPRRGTRVGTVPLGGKPEYGQSAGNGKIYVNFVDSSQIAEIDTKTLTVTRRWTHAPRKSPARVALKISSQKFLRGCPRAVWQSRTTRKERWWRRFQS